MRNFRGNAASRLRRGSRALAFGRRGALFAALFLLFFWTWLSRPAVLAARDIFDVESCRIEIEVRNNNSYLIKEIYDFNYREEARGFIRSLPLRSRYGGSVEISEVSCNQNFKLIPRGPDLDIRIGDADRKVKGEVHYELSYLYDIGQDNMSDMDEFYFNLVGPEWDTEFKDVSFRISMPKAFDEDKISFTSGSYGSTDRAPAEWSVDGLVIEGRLKGGLRPHESLTLALPLPEGYYDGELRMGVSLLERYEFYIYVIYGGFFLLVFLIGLISRRNKGKLLYRPPEGMNPVDLVYIKNGEVTFQTLTSLIMHWANMGYLRMEPVSVQTGRFGKTQEDILLTPLYPADERMKPYEKKLYEAILSRAGEDGSLYLSSLGSRFYREFKKAAQGVAAYWDREDSMVFKRKGFGKGLLRFIFTLLPLLLYIWLRIRWRELDADTWLLVLFVLGLVYYLGMVYPRSYLEGLISGSPRHFSSFIVMILTLCIGFFILNVFLFDDPDLNWKLALASYGAALIPDLFLFLGRKRTPYGQALKQEADSYMNFLRGRQHERPNWGTGNDEALYFGNMAYAYALGLSKEWSRNCRKNNLLFADEDRTYRRDRFERYDQYTRYTEQNLRSLSRKAERANRSASRSSSSSSSSGGSSSSSSSGGSSGGGSGGGGGRSW